jgi:hypothetical protein
VSWHIQNSRNCSHSTLRFGRQPFDDCRVFEPRERGVLQGRLAEIFCNGLAARAHAEFFVDAPDVIVNRVVTDVQLLRDFFLVEKSLGQQGQDFLFARGQFGELVFDRRGLLEAPVPDSSITS